MLVNFRQSFKEDNDMRTGLPHAVIEELSRELPRNTRYYLADDMLLMGPELGTEMQIGGFLPEVTDDMRKVLGKNPSSEEVLRYSYNAQRPVKLKLKDPDYIKVNGEKVALDKIIKDLKSYFKFEKGSFVMYPEAFPQPFQITVSTFDGSSSLELSVSRIPSESASVAKYESDPEGAFVMKYSIFESDKAGGRGAQVSYSFSVHPDRCETLSDAVDVMKIFKALSNGDGKISGISLRQADVNDIDVNCNFDILPWLEKALEVESAFHLSFKPKDVAITNDSIQAITELYEGLVRQCPTRMPVDHAEINVEGDAVQAIDKMATERSAGLIALTYSRTRSFNLFGHIIEVQSYCGLFGLSVSKIADPVGGMHRVELAESSEDSRGYVSQLLFKDEKALEEFLERVSMDDIMKQLQEADWLSDLIDDVANCC